jgi:hypothetical protein
MNTDEHGWMQLRKGLDANWRELARANPEFALIREIRVRFFGIRVHLCPSVVKKSDRHA